MGIVRPFESESADMEEFRRILLSCAGVRRGKDDGEQFQGRTEAESDEENLICVTSGVSYLGLAIVNRLLLRGYSVRILVTSPEDMEQLREIEENHAGEERVAANVNNNSNVRAVMADINDVHSLSEAFDGCRTVFHTAAFVDPAGLSGYSKSMAAVEEKTCENVMEACGRTSSVRNCVLTSSLLACIWMDDSRGDLAPIINHDSWSDQSVCLDKKLWYALGKLKAEKAAWRIAEGGRVKLVTLCPGLITGPEFSHRNPTPSFAYLKGSQEMYTNGLLATVDVDRLAEAHICVFEVMNKSAFGRYICFDKILRGMDEVEELERNLGLQPNTIAGNAPGNSLTFELSNVKLSKLMSRSVRCNHAL